MHYSVLRGSIGLIPSKMSVLPHPLNVLTRSRTKDKLRTGELAVSGDQWPIFLYYGYTFDPDDPWNGLFRSSLLVSVSILPGRAIRDTYYSLKAYKHIFTSPSSVEKESMATRSGNARIHGMTQVTPASITYVATQVSPRSHSSHTMADMRD